MIRIKLFWNKGWCEQKWPTSQKMPSGRTLAKFGSTFTIETTFWGLLRHLVLSLLCIRALTPIPIMLLRVTYWQNLRLNTVSRTALPASTWFYAHLSTFSNQEGNPLLISTLFQHPVLLSIHVQLRMNCPLP